MISMEDQNPVNRAGQHRVNVIFLCRHCKHQPQQVLRIREIVKRLHEGLTQRVLEGVRANGRHLRNQPMRSAHALKRIVDIRAVVIEGRERSHYTYHDGHGVGTAYEAAVKADQLLVQHGVSGNIAVELLFLFRGGQFAMQKQVAHVHEVGILGKFGYRIAAVQQDAGLTIDVGNL